MPAKSNLEDLQYALKNEDINAHLGDYAVGILVYEQYQYRKSQIKARDLLIKKLGTLDKTSSAYHNLEDKLNEFEGKIDLGFYYSIALFDKLSDTSPLEAKRMIETIVSFDTLGRYLLEKRPIILDGVPFILDSVLARHGIDVIALKKTVRQNLSHTMLFSDDFKPVAPMIETTPAETLAHSELPTTGKASKLERAVTAVRDSELLQKKAGSVPLNFHLISKLPTKVNIAAFLSGIAEMFAHAKMQDSVKLDTINTDVLAGASASQYVVVSLLQNSLARWFVLSLAQAPTIAILEQRIRFIMSVLVQANKKTPGLPAFATADLYLPLLVVARYFTKTALKHLPSVKPNLDMLKKMTTHTNAQQISKYTNAINISIGENKVALPTMRMLMIEQLTLAAAHLDVMTESIDPMDDLVCMLKLTLLTNAATSIEIHAITALMIDEIEPRYIANIEKNAKRLMVQGQIIQNYFRPANWTASLELSPMTSALSF